MRVFRQFASLFFVGAIASCPVTMGAIVAQYNLGENDGGLAVAGVPGVSPTVDAVGSNLLIPVGGPTYSSDTPGGSSTLSMAFDGSGDYYSGPAPATDLTNDISYSFDAKMIAAGAGGFSFLASLGSNYGGIAVVEIEGTVGLYYPGTGPGVGGFQPNGGWQHYTVDWDADLAVATLTVDGNVVSSASGLPANNQITNFLTLGGNSRSQSPGNLNSPPFEGSFHGLIDNFVLRTGAEVPEPSTYVLLGLGAFGLAALRRPSAKMDQNI